MANISFYTTDREMTSLIYSLINEGSFNRFFDIMDDSGVDELHTKLFLKGCCELKGDTRDEDGLYISTPEVPYEVDLKTAILTFLSGSDEYKQEGEISFNPIYSYKWKKTHKKLQNFLGEDYIAKTFDSRQDHLFDLLGYPYVNTKPSGANNINGIIIEDGTFIWCGYRGHSLLEDQLIHMGYNEDYFINISEDMIYGNLIINLEDAAHFGGETETIDYYTVLNQLRTLKRFNIVYDKYTNNSVFSYLQEYSKLYYNNGGKYGSLKFIEEFYNLSIPKISKEYFEEAKFVRSSPKKSLPGLLESYPINNEKDMGSIIFKMQEDYSEYSDIVKYNEFNYFFQEFIEGKTGVAHYNDNGFSYSLAKTNYDVVQGKQGNESLTNKNQSFLSNKLREIYLDFGKDYDIQIEFCVTEHDTIVFLQFRVFEIPLQEIKIPEVEGDIIVKGKSFNLGVIENIKSSDILIVTKDCHSSALLNKKALIVTNNVEYSHVLALSKKLNIPSLYATGDLSLNENDNYCIISTKERGELIRL